VVVWPPVLSRVWVCGMCVGVCLHCVGVCCVCRCVLGYLYYHIGNVNIKIYFIKSKCAYLGIGPPDHS
jgi:hypothetical protein